MERRLGSFGCLYTAVAVGAPAADAAAGAADADAAAASTSGCCSSSVSQVTLVSQVTSRARAAAQLQSFLKIKYNIYFEYIFLIHKLN